MARDDLGFGDDATRPLPGTSLIPELAEVPDFLPWKRRWREGGMESLRSQGPRGRRSRLSEEQLARLGQELLRSSRAHGYATDLWTCPRVGAVIRRLFGIEYSDCHVWKLLRKMGWTRQRPARRAKERDEERIANWVRARFGLG